MKLRFPLTIALVVLTAPVAFAQNATYSFDNFDTSSGIKVQVEPAKQQFPVAGRAAKSKRPVTSAAEAAPATNVKPTSLTFASTSSYSGVASSLRGFTTGSAEIDGFITDSATRHGVDPLLVYSIMHQESSFKQRAISYKGARGLMQLMPGTAARFGVTNIFDPKQNIEGGTRYMRFLLDRF